MLTIQDQKRNLEEKNIIEAIKKKQSRRIFYVFKTKSKSLWLKGN